VVVDHNLEVGEPGATAITTIEELDIRDLNTSLEIYLPPWVVLSLRVCARVFPVCRLSIAIDGSLRNTTMSHAGLLGRLKCCNIDWALVENPTLVPGLTTTLGNWFGVNITTTHQFLN
jgi:hypothetical protein